MNKYLAFLSIALAALHVNAQAEWSQCGGMGYTGPTSCNAGLTCVKLNDFFSQCQRLGTAPPTTQPPTTQPPTTQPPTTQPPTTQPPTTQPPTTQPPTTTQPPQPTGSGLDYRFQMKGKKFWGTCADQNLLNNANNAAIIRADIGSVTPENSMKWDNTEPSRGNFNFGGGDFLVNWATTNGKLVRGHTLVWHSQLPGWVNNINDRATLTTVIENHVNSLMGRWKGKIYAWDVINEMFEENGSLRGSVFSRVFGESFVTLTFQAARRADPDAVLYINDYNLDSDNAKLRGLIGVVNRANANGAKVIDGIGTQGHLSAGQSGGMAAAVNAAAGTGLDVAITELDIINAGTADYQAVVRACLNQPRCVSITSWGIRDTDSWRASNNPLLWNGSYQPKPAYTAVMQVLA